MALYQADVTEQPVAEILTRWRSYRGDLDEHAASLVAGVERELEELDALLSEVSEGWPVHRMSVVDRAIMRLALYEILHVEDVPAEVAINEGMEIAKGFSSEESPAFVGGVLRGAAVRKLGSNKVEHG